jgi:hypothetical protein
MRISYQVTNEASRRLREIAANDAPEARTHLADEALRGALARIIATHPVRTGRSRAGWQAALDQFGGGTASRGGLRGAGAAMSSAGFGGEGFAQRDDDAETTTVSASNTVPYVPFLEYGTSRMAPFAMVRRALAEVQQLVKALFKLGA